MTDKTNPRAAPNMMLMGEGGSINPERVLMIVSMKSAPVKRLIKQVDPSRVVDMTYGYPRRSLVIFDNGMMAITRYEVDELSLAIRQGEAVHDDTRIAF